MKIEFDSGSVNFTGTHEEISKLYDEARSKELLCDFDSGTQCLTIYALGQEIQDSLREARNKLDECLHGHR